MFDPNDIITYISTAGQQEGLKAMEEMPEWLKSFLANDDEYDIYSKQRPRCHTIYSWCFLGHIHHTSIIKGSPQMTRGEILHGLEIVIFKHPRVSWHYDLLDELQDRGYVDWFSWYDENKQRQSYRINATQKGLTYYADNKGKRTSKFYYVLALFILLIPYLII